jgi:Condensin II complex subunit CAP-H2 or CNDH2, C-term
MDVIRRLLSCRVSSWQQKILPVVEDQEARGEFDIHRYGERILDRLGEVQVHSSKAAGSGSPVGFGQVVSSNQQYEISR